LPTREEFASDIESLRKIDEYKKEYLKTLRLTRTITSVDIMPEELHNYQNIYLDLLMNLFEEDNNEVSFESPDDIIDEELDLSIKCLKLRLYLEHVRELVIETKLRLIALNEILKEKKLSKTRENAVLNEINNLQHSLFIFQNQEWLMIKAIHNNLINIKNIDFKTFLENIDNQNIEEVNDEVIDKRLEEVREMALSVIPDIVGYLESLNLSPKMLIATLEQELEIYVYTHKDDLKVLSEETENLATTLVDLSLEELQKEQKAYIDTIHILELRYKIFSKYGRKLITKEEIEELYKSKFKVLISDIFEDTYNGVLNNATKMELRCFCEILFKIVANLIKGDNKQVSELAKINGITYSYIEKLIIAFLNESGSFDYEGLLQLYNKEKLQLLIAIEFTSFQTFFTKVLGDKVTYCLNYPDFTFSEMFHWNSFKLPLRTIYHILNWHIKAGFIKEKSIGPIYSLYKLYMSTEDSNVYKLPEGLWSIYVSKDVKDNKKLMTLVKIIRKEAKDKNVILPSSLKHFYGNLFGNSAKTIILNNGLEVLDYTALSEANITELILPSSLKEVSFSSWPRISPQVIKFNDYQNSHILNDDSQLKNIIYYYKSKFIANDKDNEEISKYQFYPTFNSIELCDEFGALVLKLEKDDLSCFGYRHWTQDMLLDEEQHILPKEKDSILNHIRNKIHEKLALEEDSNMGTITRKN